MLRNLLLLILITIALALLRWLVTGVVRAVSQALGGPLRKKAGREPTQGPQTVSGHLVRDPVSGTYIDENLAIKEVIDGKTVYFESKETRDTYLREARSR